MNKGIIWGCGFIEIDNVDLDLALSAITKELEKNRDNWEAWAAKADILYSMELYENAILCCDRSLAINPDNPFTEATKANALNKLKKRNEDIGRSISFRIKK